MSKCIVDSTDKVTICEQLDKKARFINKASVRHQKGVVDNCLISDHRERCDYFVRTISDIWFVELKGRDVLKASNQIVSTILHLKSEIGTRNVTPVIVSSKCPSGVNQTKDLAPLKRAGCKDIVLRTRLAEIVIS